jgi:dTDP-4-dehydrorhamnose reductase
MRILVIGKNGQLGQSIRKVVDEDNNYLDKNHFTFIGREQFNLASINDISYYLNNTKFDIVINCAAYTNVDKAEIDKKNANLINHTALKKIAKLAKINNMKLIHISTDFVFDGEKCQPYVETDTTSPLNVYGETKLAGELALMSIMKLDLVIIRTGWVYSEFGHNFLKTILSLAKKNDSLDIVLDQVGTPTYAYDLARSILSIVATEKFLKKNRPSEIFHYSNLGESSWYDFAREIITISGIHCQINPISTKDYLLPAKRPKYSVLCKKKIMQEYDLKIENWKDSLAACLKNL